MNIQIDTNAIIDYLGGKLPPNAVEQIENLKSQKQALISIIVEIELLSAKKYSDVEDFRSNTELRALETFLHECKVLPLTGSIAKRTYLLRRNHKIKVPDAIIAATSLEKGLNLLTRNISDFSSIDELNIIDPHSL